MAGSYGSFDKNEVVKTVHKARDIGITLFDTAQCYGKGAGEEFLGRALKGKRHDCIIVTKGGLCWEPNKPSRDSSKKTLNKILEGSLGRLQTDWSAPQKGVQLRC